MNYTLAQVRAFLDAVERQERERLVTRFALQVSAQRGDGAEIKRLFKELAR